MSREMHKIYFSARIDTSKVVLVATYKSADLCKINTEKEINLQKICKLKQHFFSSDSNHSIIFQTDEWL